MGIMQGKKGLIMGVANERSLAWGIAKAIADQGAEIAFSYQGEALKKRVEPLGASVGSNTFVEMDVADESQLDKGFAEVEKAFGKIDFFLHAVGWSDKNELRGKYMDTSKDNFLKTMEISAWSFTSTARRAAAIMNDGGSMLTLTYGGASRVMPHYNVMGVAKAALESSVMYLATDLGERQIRVNALSAGPVKTLAASGIGDFRYILNWNKDNAPLQRNIDLEDVGGSGLYLLSDLSSGVTGETHFVDGGYHTVGMKSMHAILKEKSE
ncbi:MAG: enoyl-ACP reductase [Alphaproteobacteria bacterium]